MARKELDITIGPEGGRDAGKTYHITEMSADAVETWALMVLCAAKRADPDLDIDMGAGLAGLMDPVLKALLKGDYLTLKGILADLMGCVELCPDAQNPKVRRRPTLPGDIEEVATRMRLEREVFRLHVGF
jgi:hypothetical protein